jgi:hypothetical protein
VTSIAGVLVVAGHRLELSRTLTIIDDVTGESRHLEWALLSVSLAATLAVAAVLVISGLMDPAARPIST